MTYSQLTSQIQELFCLAKVDTTVIGCSMLNQPIYCFHVGNYGPRQIVLTGGIHAREYISTLVLIRQIFYLNQLAMNEQLNGGIYIIPLVNPDGVRMVLDGPMTLPCTNHRNYMITINGGSPDFSLWKANANAVDINVNLDANWGQGLQNVICPAPGNFIGFYANSERESNNLIRFAETVKPKLIVDYHSKGSVIYYGFEALPPEQIARDRQIAELFSQENGYLPVQSIGSVGAFTDWLSLYYGIPAFTLELGRYDQPHPIGPEYTQELFELNKNIPLIALNQI